MDIKQFASMGGRASWAGLTPDERSERASKNGKKGGWPKGKKRKNIKGRDTNKALAEILK